MSISEMSQGERYDPVEIDLRCDFPGAEIQLVDGQQKLVGRAPQRLSIKVPPGIYTARVLIGESLRDELIVVRPDKPFSHTLTAPAVASAIPLGGSAQSNEYQAAARDTTKQIQLHADCDSSIFVLMREGAREGIAQQQAATAAAPALTLCSAEGDSLHSFDMGVVDAMAGGAAAQGVRLRGGFYRLVSQFGSAVVEMPVYAVKDWQTQIYLLSQATPGGLAPDFGRASIFWARPGSGFDPNSADLQVLESVRSSAESGRRLLTDQGLTEYLYEKYQNPMLGLLSAHALRVRDAIKPETLRTVTSNLEAMLGPIPDVVALKLAVDPNAEVAPVEYPPMLRWSWELLLERSVDRSDIIRRHSLVEEIGGHVIDRGVWLSWLAFPQVRMRGSSGSVASDVAVEAVRETWKQMGRATVATSRAAKKRASAAPALESMASPDTAGRNWKNLVQMYGVPRAVVEEAVGSLPLNEPYTPQQERGVNAMNQAKRRQFNERFFQRLLDRRPQDRPIIESTLREEQQRQQQRRRQPEAALEDLQVEPSGQIRRDPRELALETIVSRERPVLFVQDGNFNTTDVTTLGPEAVDLVNRMKQQGGDLVKLLPLIGRIDVVNFPNNLDFVGTAWFVDTDIVVTNRHVASLIAQWDGRKFAFARGIGGREIESSFCNAHEFDDLAPDSSRIFGVTEVLYIEGPTGPDIAFLRVDRRTDGRGPSFIEVAATDAAAELPVCVIGYPARAPKRVIPNQELMKELYRDRYDVKRAAPGFTSGIEEGATTHDCTTLGGNSGSAVIDLATGQAVGLHFAGLYEEDNFAVRAAVLTDYIRRKRWSSPAIVETRSPMPSAPAPSFTASGGAVPVTIAGASPGSVATVSITVPVTVTVTIGAPTSNAGADAPGANTNIAVTATQANPPVVDVARVEEVLRDYWQNRPPDVIGARVGYFDSGDSIGDVPCIAASVKPSELASFELGAPTLYKGVPVRYIPADIDEQVQALPNVEAVDSISYDDDARTGDRFSLAQVNEAMEVIMHVGPEYSWDVLQKFLADSQGRLVSAIYEFHAPHIKDALEDRLANGGSLSMMLDNATFTKADGAFDRVEVFEDWADRFTFTRMVAPEGLNGLISDSYHIKVTVRDDDTFWLSSGNWKAGSSQPVITQAQRDDATTNDLPGNREWHVVIKNKKLATRFRSHILQDLKRSEDLGGREVPKSLLDETLVDVPIEQPMELEARRPPGRLVEPRTIASSSSRKIKVRPLLTPDQEGAVYSEAVLELIESAETSLLFQIPYIGLPSKPNDDRGFIDALIKALTNKLKTLDDARLLLRAGGSRFSAPSHAAWYFKSKGVDIDKRLKVIDNHHTKGMIVDGQRVLLGSHNWSKSGVSLNRDASLLFDDEEVAKYYAEAFEVDWARAGKIRPRKFVKEAIREAVGDAPPPGFRRVRLSELLKDD